MARDYTVIVYPPPQDLQSVVVTFGTGQSHQPKVVTVRLCATPAEAARKADVLPGGRCEVVVDARHFRRAKEAPLEELDADLAPLPQAANA